MIYRAGCAHDRANAEVVGGDALEERPERVRAGEHHHVESEYPAPEPVVDRQLDGRHQGAGDCQVAEADGGHRDQAAGVGRGERHAEYRKAVDHNGVDDEP